MKIKIVTVGKLKEKYLKEWIAEYIKRLGRFAKVEQVELVDEKLQIVPVNSKINKSLKKRGNEFSLRFQIRNM